MTNYEKITQLRETATLISQMEFKIQMNEGSISQLEKFNSHKENTDLIHDLGVQTDLHRSHLIGLKQQFDSQLSQIKPYYN